MGSEDEVRIESEYSGGYNFLFNGDKNCFFSFNNRPNTLHLNVQCLADSCALSSNLKTSSKQRAPSTARTYTFRLVPVYICQKSYFFHIFYLIVKVLSKQI